MAHPDRVRAAPGIGQEGARSAHGQLGAAVLTAFVAAHDTTTLVGNELGAVTDAQDGHPQVVDARVDPGSTIHVDRSGTTAEDDSSGPTGGVLVG